MRVWIAEDPMTCVVRGTGVVLDDIQNSARFLVGLSRSGG
jgi:rod shape-determining protein MreB